MTPGRIKGPGWNGNIEMDKRFKGKKIGVLMGGMSEEREISLKTGAAVLKALCAKGYRAVQIDAGRDLAARLASEGVGAAFIALHGRYGEDGCVQGMCEVMGIPYTGSGVRASSVAMDKIASKTVFLFHGITAPAMGGITDNGRIKGVRLPVVVKPAAQGSAIGVSVVRKSPELEGAIRNARKYGPSVIVEEYIEGRELTVSILCGDVLPIVEIRPKEGFYDYRAKYTKGLTEFTVPARIAGPAAKRVGQAALAAYHAIGCRGAARIDVMLRGNVPYVLEANTVPGLTELSLFPMAARHAGIDYPDLVERMLLDAGLDRDSRDRDAERRGPDGCEKRVPRQ